MHITNYKDDLTGKPLATSDVNVAHLTHGGRRYELHLSDESLTKLDNALTPFIWRSKLLRDLVDSEVIRRWGKKTGWDIADKGRLPKALIEAYNNEFGQPETSVS